jgi:hypothetical protein
MRISRLFVVVASLASIATAIACSRSSNDTTVTGPEQDWVTQSTFDKAYGIVKGIDYLPFEYKDDGCFARALYMAMELASEGLESNEVFAFAAPLTQLTPEYRWTYHVAPMLEVGPSANSLVHMIVDPSLATTPLSEDEWIAKLVPIGSDGGVVDAAPTTLIAPGSDYDRYEAIHDDAHAGRDTPDFSDLPPFKQSDVQSACNFMWNYIQYEPQATKTTIDQKQGKLLARTPALLAALKARGKLTEDSPFATSDCELPLE